MAPAGLRFENALTVDSVDSPERRQEGTFIAPTGHGKGRTLR